MAVFGLSGVPKSNFKDLAIVRIGSEFVSLTTPSLIGGVVVELHGSPKRGLIQEGPSGSLTSKF